MEMNPVNKSLYTWSVWLTCPQKQNKALKAADENITCVERCGNLNTWNKNITKNHTCWTDKWNVQQQRFPRLKVTVGACLLGTKITSSSFLQYVFFQLNQKANTSLEIMTYLWFQYLPNVITFSFCIIQLKFPWCFSTQMFTVWGLIWSFNETILFCPLSSTIFRHPAGKLVQQAIYHNDPTPNVRVMVDDRNAN